MEPIIQIENLRKIYRMGNEKVVALDEISLEIQKGEVCCMLGTSGSGKSTLLNMIAGLEKPTKGSIVIKNKHIEKMNEKQVTNFRQKNVGFVFQSYNLLPNLTALENVSMPLVFAGMHREKRDKQAAQMLKAVGLGDRLHHRPSQMSGGQQQRVSIARAFVAKPEIVFADEPTGNLDTKTTFEIMELMVNMCREYNQTLIIVTHDQETAVYADRVIYVRDGNIEKVEMNKAKI
ncbi:ABC transporter ATP-binding protein [Clostridium sp. ZS2-4]|uniref:ABC transporter ATP-binding protein n=1 Tax=Clostridium sp. ZS2-4 TaxID=2987703 RepID=UPI003FA3CB81